MGLFKRVKKIFKSGENPLKQAVRGVSDLYVKPAREIARTAGAKGLVDVGNKVAGTKDAITGGLIDKASGRDQRIKEGIEAENNRLAAAEKAAGIEQAKKQALAENQRIESERMAVGSKSKTLLTSAMGLEDDEDSVSKRALMGF